MLASFSVLGTGTYSSLIWAAGWQPLGFASLRFSPISIPAEIPAKMTMRHILLIGIISSIGFTVALFVSQQRFLLQATYWTELKWEHYSAL